MRVWTIQPIEVYELIEKMGVYYCDENKVREDHTFFDECFKDAYDWLIEKMKGKIGNAPEGVKYPVWAWHTYDWKRKSSDLRARQGYRGQKMVRLELEIPDNEIVLSDFDSWHCVLNDWYLIECNSEEDWEKESDRFDTLPYQEREKLKKESWNNIFDITPVNTDWCKNGAYIQATFWILRKEYIKKVKFFTSK